MTRVTFEKGAKLARIEGKLDNPTAALKQIGALMVAESQRAFKVQEFDGEKWQPRAPVNIFGIIADFHEGRRKPPQRRFERRPALRDTGRLSSSISFRLVGSRAVEIGTNLPYAGVHQRGGEVESKPITREVQRNLWAWLKNQPLQMRRRLGFLLSKRYTDQTLKGSVPERRFIGITRRTREFVQKAVGVRIMEVR